MPGTAPTALPGSNASRAEFDAPLAMLHACHERVRHNLSLLRAIGQRVAAGRVDGAVHSAARGMLHYVDEAAQQHREFRLPNFCSLCKDTCVNE